VDSGREHRQVTQERRVRLRELDRHLVVAVDLNLVDPVAEREGTVRGDVVVASVVLVLRVDEAAVRRLEVLCGELLAVVEGDPLLQRERCRLAVERVVRGEPVGERRLARLEVDERVS